MFQKFSKFIIYLAVIVLLIWPVLSFGQNFPGVDTGNKVRVPWFFPGATGPAGQPKFGNLITTILNIALAIVGSVAVAFLVYGAFRYITAHGNEEQAESAKTIIRQSILGLIIVILAFAIITVIARLLILGRLGAF